MRFASRTFRKKKTSRSSSFRSAKAARTRRSKQRRQRTRRFRKHMGGAYPIDLGQSIPRGVELVDSGTKSKEMDDAVETSLEVTQQY